jgi:hypothetical protein
VLREALLFWRLKAKVLSETPYVGELAAFKESTKTDVNFSILEKYADHGLQGLKHKVQEASPSVNEPTTVWSRLKASVQSAIKIEKVDPNAPEAPRPPESPDRSTVEEALSHIEQTLIQKLSSQSLFPSSQTGDAL